MSGGRLIIVGGSGLIGSSLHEAAMRERRNVVGTYTATPTPGLVRYDMRAEPLRSIVPDLGPGDVVYLLSAYSNPSWIFANQALARELNLDATRRLIDEIAASGARIIFMSSVEVFDGTAGNYGETAQPRPLNLYGEMKYAIERHLNEVAPRSTIVRTGWNVGWDTNHRCVVTLTYRTLLSPDARMADDNTFSISDVRDTAEGLLRLADIEPCPVIHLASRRHFIRKDLADLIIAISARGPRMSYRPAPFAEIPYSEPRARCNHLDTSQAVEVHGMTFRDADAIVADKVTLLDRHSVS